MQSIAYKPNALEVMQRLQTLWDRHSVDRIFATFAVPSKTLNDFRKNHAEGYCDYPYPTERLVFWDHLLKERMYLEDDSIPSAYLSEFDQGLYGGLLGGDVQFLLQHDNGWISSMVSPLLKNWKEFESLKIDTKHPWFDIYLKQLQIFIEGSKKNFSISHFILINHLNLAFELVGATETYLAMIERPEIINKVIDLAHQLNMWVQSTFFQYVPLLRSGTCSNMVQWIPGKIISESLDPFHMTSVDDFEKWGRAPVQRMFDQFDGGVLHIHGNGRHLLEAACSLKGLKAIFLGDDKGFPLAFDILSELRKRTDTLPLVVQVDFPAFIEHLEKHTLCGGVLYQVKDAPDIKSSNRCMEKVRAYRI
jgi:hypothetical protein